MRPRLKRALLATGGILGAAFIAIQFRPVQRTNPLGAGDPHASREVMWVLRRACYDCHSNETRWPIWAYVAPVSWQVVKDVETARSRINFSNWQAYTAQQQAGLKQVVVWSTSTHRMPLWYYVTLHPDARMNPAELKALADWARDTTTRPSAGSQ
jgi:hypothetical protein